MAFDKTKWDVPASQGDVAGIALYTGRALTSLSSALNKLARKAEVDISDELATVLDAIKSLDEVFNDFTGWTPDENER